MPTEIAVLECGGTTFDRLQKMAHLTTASGPMLPHPIERGRTGGLIVVSRDVCRELLHTEVAMSEQELHRSQIAHFSIISHVGGPFS